MNSIKAAPLHMQQVQADNTHSLLESIGILRLEKTLLQVPKQLSLPERLSTRTMAYEEC